MVQAFYNEQSVTLEGEPYRLVLNFAAIDATESMLTPLTYDAIVAQVIGGSAGLGVQAKVVWGLLRQHHPDITIDQATTFLFGETGETLGVAIGKLILAAFPLKEAAPVGTGNPPKPRGASASSSSNGRRQGSPRKPSGDKRPARSSPRSKAGPAQ